MNRIWTKEEDQIIRNDRAAGVATRATAAKLNRPIPATFNRAIKIGATVQPHRSWTEAEKQTLREALAMTPKPTDKELEIITGRKTTSFRPMLETLGLIGPRNHRAPPTYVKRAADPEYQAARALKKQMKLEAIAAGKAARKEARRNARERAQQIRRDEVAARTLDRTQATIARKAKRAEEIERRKALRKAEIEARKPKKRIRKKQTDCKTIHPPRLAGHIKPAVAAKPTATLRATPKNHGYTPYPPRNRTDLIREIAMKMKRKLENA